MQKALNNIFNIGEAIKRNILKPLKIAKYFLAHNLGAVNIALH